ncbi:MAG: hypothetical protein RL322_2751 [Pseudomonadota bacterium]|jgi:16S rRNA G1207 methylase RsmC
MIHWDENGQERSARWHSERGAPPPRSVEVVDDRLTADAAFGRAGQGIGLLWRGDFQNARQLLVALAARIDRRSVRRSAQAAPTGSATAADRFNQVRQARAQRARTLGMILIEMNADYQVPLRRAPDVTAACQEAIEASGSGSLVLSLRELLGMIGAHQWRLKGIEMPAAGGRIHPHYGVFTPTRSEYVDLVTQTPLPRPAAQIDLAFDIGTGTGVLAAVLARRGLRRIVATDTDPRALNCAHATIERLSLTTQIEIRAQDLFPEGRADLVICNPPWVPARPGSALERGIYDPDSVMLRRFLAGLSAHLTDQGEGWLILSDLAEHLGLRSRDTLLSWIAEGGLTVAGRHDARPSHPKASDRDDPLFAARQAETTSLWRLHHRER